MSPHPNETPHERTGTVDPTGGDRHGAVTDRDGATLDPPAGRPSPAGTGISTAIAARVTGRWTEPQFEALLEHVDDCAVFVLDEHGHVLTWNDWAEAVTGHTTDDVVGKHVSVLYREADAEAGVPERDLRSAAEEGGRTFHGWRVRADGSAFRAETTITPLREGEQLTGFVNVTRDLTDERCERELRERCERLEELLAAVSHDLRGPLTVAAGNAELAAETGETERLDAIDRALDRAEELLDCLTTLAEEGEYVRETDPVELREVTEAAWDVTETGGAELSVEGDTAFPADRCRTQQLLENLLGNAVEHGPTDDEGDVTVRVGPLPDRCGFYVADDGQGVPEADRERVFESGYSADEDGTGFGLAIVRTIAEAHGWSVTLTESEAGGARFEVTTGPD